MNILKCSFHWISRWLKTKYYTPNVSPMSGQATLFYLSEYLSNSSKIPLSSASLTKWHKTYFLNLNSRQNQNLRHFIGHKIPDESCKNWVKYGKTRKSWSHYAPFGGCECFSEPFRKRAFRPSGFKIFLDMTDGTGAGEQLLLSKFIW